MNMQRPEIRRSNIDTASRHNSSLVFEFGSAFLRVGISGESKPRHVFSLPSDLSERRDMSQQSFWRLFPPLPQRLLSRNNEVGYQDMGAWFFHLYNVLLLKPRSRRVIIILPRYHPPELKSNLRSILLETLHVPSILFTDPFSCIPYAVASNSGIIIDVGSVEGRIVCYYDGVICEDTLQIVPAGFQSLVAKVMAETEEISEDEIYEKIKKKDAAIGHIVQYLYFSETQDSLLFAFLSSLLQCHVDMRKQVVRNVVFVGGAVEGIPEFEQMFLKSIHSGFTSASKNLPANTTLKDKRYNDKSIWQKFVSLAPVIMTAPLSVVRTSQNRSCIAWMGGSVMGSIKISDDRWLERG